jgi:histidine ammonia-lyase
VRLAPAAIRRLERARKLVERFAAGERKVYGLNTGLGAAVDTALKPHEVAAFQHQAVMARAVGVGDSLAVEEVRAALFVRLAGLAHGASGLSPAVAQTIVRMLNRHVHPRVRRIGTLGEADLSPMAQLFLPLVGQGKVELGGKLLDGAEALKRARIAAPALGPKDAIALLNSNGYSVGKGALTLHDARRVLEAATLAGALSLEAAGANISPIDPRAVALRPAPGQAEASKLVMSWLAGGALRRSRKPRRVQDPLSFRCLAPVAGAAFDQFARARLAIEADLNGAGDSPAVLIASGEMMSTVNFDTTATALAFEGLGLALSHVAATSVFRIAKLMSPGFSGLPRFLTPMARARTGFATVQKTASALEAQIRHLALPLGALTAPVADGVEDYAPMTPRVVEKTHDIIRHLARLTAIEFVTAAQAIDLSGNVQLGGGTAKAFATVRREVPKLEEDRPTGPEFEFLAGAILAGWFAA